jgi:hypothetical protein
VRLLGLYHYDTALPRSYDDFLQPAIDTSTHPVTPEFDTNDALPTVVVELLSPAPTSHAKGLLNCLVKGRRSRSRMRHITLG